MISSSFDNDGTEDVVLSMFVIEVVLVYAIENVVVRYVLYSIIGICETDCCKS